MQKSIFFGSVRWVFALNSTPKGKTKIKKKGLSDDTFIQVGHRTKISMHNVGKSALIERTCLLHHKFPAIWCRHFLKYLIKMIVSLLFFIY